LGYREVIVAASNNLDTLETFQPAAQRVNVTAIDPTDDTQPVSYNWSFMVANRLPGQITWEVGYVGNSSRDLDNSGFQRP
jgi:hypothetical protein